MKESLARFAVAFLELLEAEGALLRLRLVSAGSSCCLMAAGTVMFFVGICLFARAGYMWMLPRLGPVWTCIVIGTGFFSFGIWLFWSAHETGMEE